MKIYESDWCSWMNFDKMGLKWNITRKYKPGGRCLSGGLPSAILAEAPSLFYNDDVFLWWLRWWQCWTLGWFTMMIMVVKMLMRQTTAKSNISSSTIAFVYIDDGGVFVHNNDYWWWLKGYTYLISCTCLFSFVTCPFGT